MLSWIKTSGPALPSTMHVTSLSRGWGHIAGTRNASAVNMKLSSLPPEYVLRDVWLCDDAASTAE